MDGFVLVVDMILVVVKTYTNMVINYFLKRYKHKVK